MKRLNYLVYKGIKMDRKYEIVAAHTLMPMFVQYRKRFNDFNDEDELSATISVGVNYAQDKIVFNGERIDGVDYDDLEQEILAYLRPGIPLAPNISPEIMDRIAKVRSGEYQAAFNKTEIDT